MNAATVLELTAEFHRSPLVSFSFLFPFYIFIYLFLKIFLYIQNPVIFNHTASKYKIRIVYIYITLKQTNKQKHLNLLLHLHLHTLLINLIVEQQHSFSNIQQLIYFLNVQIITSALYIYLVLFTHHLSMMYRRPTLCFF